MATSEVAVANAALQKLGSPARLESLTQDHPNARTMNAAYARVRDAELRRYDWGFSIQRASIAADGTQTTGGGRNRFSLPNDYLKLIRDDESGQAPDWRIEGCFIVTADASPLQIRYVAKITDPNAFDSLFFEAFASKLALETCKEVTGSTDLKKDLRGDYDFAIEEAKRIGSIEKPAQMAPEDDWVNARL